MKLLKLALVAGTLTGGVAGSASAMPADTFAGLKSEGVQAEKTALVCNRWGRCWHTGYRAYGYGYGWHHRHWHRW
jgi:hypothetical protein